ncbi:MAG: hypothetical protein CME13_17015 [Gemmatimonadetes bacterium]|nr:hypothetical protein [Gemmatimonadota bacterium]
MRRDWLWITLCAIGVVRPAHAEAQDQYLQGRVVEAASGEPLTGAVVVVGDRSAGTVSDEDGRFGLTVPDDVLVLEVSLIGYRSWISDSVRVAEGDTLWIEIPLEVDATPCARLPSLLDVSPSWATRVGRGRHSARKRSRRFRSSGRMSSAP